MLTIMQGKGNPGAMLVGIDISTAIVEKPLKFLKR